ncbi:putative MFS metabolite transporter [Sulfurimonas denitrificans DSM 1251]|uniref:Putative MFS metabolite transporter n=2 Tax=Sulfurimonas denitrificans TaxID=39766 RepID=Q30UK5_SULDN|nr:putative MFS metabolite transporter [Sulfurimonas denitrificans DSM 1251]
MVLSWNDYIKKISILIVQLQMSIILAIFYFFYFSIIGVYVIFLPKVLSMAGYGASDIGIIFAAAPLVRFVVPFAFIKGLKINIASFNIALLIMSLSSISFYFSLDSFYKLLFSNITLGIGLSIVLPYIEVISLQYLKKERYGKVRLFGSVGFILVALVLVKFLDDPRVALLYLLILTFITAFIGHIIAKKAATILEKQVEHLNDINILKDWKLWLGLTLMQVSFGSFYNFFTIYTTDHGVTLDVTIYLWTFGVIVEIFMLYSQGSLLRKNLLLILQLSTLATALRWFLLFLFPSSIGFLFFSQSLHALSFALFHSAAISYLFYLYKHKSLAQQFFSGITYGFGAFLGALIAGYVYEFYPSYLFLSATLIALMAAWFLYLWGSSQKGVNNQQLD